MQLNLINTRLVALVSQDRSRWPLAGDQLFVDLDLSDGNLPPGTRLAIGIGRDRGHRRAAHRLLEVRRTLRRSTR